MKSNVKDFNFHQLEVGFKLSCESSFQRQEIIDQHSMLGLGKALFHKFYSLFHFSLSRVISYDNLIYQEFFFVNTTTNEIKRTIYNILDVFTFIGGLLGTMFNLSNAFFEKYSFQTFKLKAI
jgi:hypothetical protein